MIARPFAEIEGRYLDAWYMTLRSPVITWAVIGHPGLHLFRYRSGLAVGMWS